jgi:hypothetical protein
MAKKKDKSEKKASEKRISTLVKKTKKKKPAVSPEAAILEEAIKISPDDIGLRAYYISERRIAEGRVGCSDSDWLEAERQLQAEARNKAGKKKK